MERFQLTVTATERSGTVGFHLDGGHTITDDDTGEHLGGTYNQGMSTTLVWRGRKVRVSHLDLLREFIRATAPEDIEAYDESLMEEGSHAGT